MSVAGIGCFGQLLALLFEVVPDRGGVDFTSLDGGVEGDDVWVYVTKKCRLRFRVECNDTATEEWFNPTFEVPTRKLFDPGDKLGLNALALKRGNEKAHSSSPLALSRSSPSFFIASSFHPPTNKFVGFLKTYLCTSAQTDSGWFALLRKVRLGAEALRRLAFPPRALSTECPSAVSMFFAAFSSRSW